ncbi:GNAT family N-acetyltransferase [Carboxylicivirga mesophila]|uniref:GNAT family N-acetyltransferase n=1 Tax=Carboxylicivirga mesophila TaxID=1166478 RepID=A0ABS5KA02_9BACT|nr:GNAT family N-acetyltransferase [Carboxylicivirga mesophila]MBS2211835.1 GNAT family N-acetyltransferase [Carboxylicivirga mesophila]
MTALNIRKATSSDLVFLLRLEKEAFPVFQQTSANNLRHAIKSPFQEVLIVESGRPHKQSIACAILYKYKHTLRIYSIGVCKDYQQKGVGEYILCYIKEMASRLYFKKIILEASADNIQLLRWYEAKGFEKKDILENYYGEGHHACKMVMSIGRESGQTNNLIVINHPNVWKDISVNARIVSVKEYINNPTYQNGSGFRVFNLCSSYKYQSYGYYVSLLASARGQRVIPSNATIRDLRINLVIQSAAYEIDEQMNRLLSKSDASQFSLNVYFGQTPDKTYKALALSLYQLYEAPLFKVTFVRHERWLIKDIKVLNIKTVPKEDESTMYDFANRFFKKKRYNFPRLTNFKYDLAILVNAQEENPPSNDEALQKMKKAANRKGVYVEFITKADVDKLNEFDALFIRETTNVNHYTYEMARLAYAEGLVVLDDPWSILRCSNKIYQNELFRKNKIKTPETLVLTKNFFNKNQLDQWKYPMVLKQPDSAFSLGVIKVESREEAEAQLMKLFKKSDMIVCQEFLYSEFDWRIGILDNKPLYACKYYMSGNHWQIYNWDSAEDDKAGAHETIAVVDVPDVIIQTAQKAASLIGDGLYGVDLKLVDDVAYVVEVNDNPNIDAGIEDSLLEGRLYEQLVDAFINRIEQAKNVSKINFSNDKVTSKY